jgi:hypothetical protein
VDGLDRLHGGDGNGNIKWIASYLSVSVAFVSLYGDGRSGVRAVASIAMQSSNRNLPNASNIAAENPSSQREKSPAGDGRLSGGPVWPA